MHCECCRHLEPLNGGWKRLASKTFCSVACLVYHQGKTCGCFAPGHTDLMVTPESLDNFLKANPLK